MQSQSDALPKEIERACFLKVALHDRLKIGMGWRQEWISDVAIGGGHVLVLRFELIKVSVDGDGRQLRALVHRFQHPYRSG